MKPSRREGFSLKSDKLLFAFGNYITAVFGNFNNILNTHAESSFKIDARFYAEYHSGFGDNIAKRRKTRIFMNFKSKAVAKTVTELAFITRFVNHVAGNGVNAVAGNSGAHGVNGRGLCLINKVIYLFLFFGNFANGNRSGHIGAISVMRGAEIHCNEVALFYFVKTGYCVGH